MFHYLKTDERIVRDEEVHCLQNLKMVDNNANADVNRIELVSAHVPGSNKNIKSIIFILHIEEKTNFVYFVN